MLRMQEKLARARARAKILENVASLVKNRNYNEKYWEIINNLYIPGKPRRSRGGKNLRYKFRSSTVTDKQQKASLNITSVHLFTFLDFINIFIRYRPRQCISELPVMATEMVSITVFSNKELFNRNLNKFHRCLLKTYVLHAF